MTNELQEMKELFEQIDQRIKQLEEKCKEEDDKWPRNGDKFYAVDYTGEVINMVYGGVLWSEQECKQISKIGNVFKTKEEAEFAVEKLKVIQELKQLARPFKPGASNCMIQYDIELEIFVLNISEQKVVAYGDFYFNNQEEAEKAVEKIGEDRIKKYLFGVE